MKKGFSFSLLFFAAILFSSAQTILINTGSVWKYSTGTDLGIAWKDAGYNDSGWSQGPSELGYGETGQATTIPSGPLNNYYPTYYFRHSFNVSNPSSFQAFMLHVKRDDGIIVYVNGIEVFRDNLPAGIIQYSTWALTVAADDGNTWHSAVLSPAMLNSGSNLIAVEVHQSSAASSDVTFDLQLTAGTPPAAALTRGPYLQLGTPTSLFFRWRTDIKTDSKVSYGATAGSLNRTAADFFSTTEHIVHLTGLSPDTKYYYSIGNAGQTLQGDTNNYFITAPLAGTEKITRIWATGDCGTAQTVQTKVMTAYQNFIGNNYTHLWLLLGDNAYDYGRDSEYQSKFFQPYMNGKVMRQTVLFPAPGNHDYANSSDSLEIRTLAYYRNFTLPTAGEAGGFPSGTEMYYSYNYANIHFISLDSYGTENNKKLFDTTSAQIAWLQQDLAANTQKWTILYWHHPPYTKGSHNSDTESELVNIRDKVLRILDRYRVDVILCGHSHNYERSKIMKGHYGLESTYNPYLHNASSSSGRYDGTANSCPYIKSSANVANEGIVYVVSGSAGKLGGTSTGYPHDAMYYSNSLTGGSLYLEVNGNRLDAKWIDENGNIMDQFTLLKDVNNSTNVTISYGDNVNLTASWNGVYQWSPVSSALKTINVSPEVTTNYIVSDGSFNCVHDTFNVKVIAQQSISLATGWNTISGYVIPDTPNISKVFEDIVSNIILVKNNAGQSYIPSLNINTIGNWDYRQGYKVKASSSAALSLCCTKAATSTPISVPAGWSTLSYLNQNPMNITTALSSLGTNIILVKNNSGQSYIPSLNINTIGNMIPGQGYQIKMAAPGTLVYPP